MVWFVKSTVMRHEADRVCAEMEQRLADLSRYRLSYLSRVMEALQDGSPREIEREIGFLVETSRAQLALRSARKDYKVKDHKTGVPAVSRAKTVAHVATVREAPQVVAEPLRQAKPDHLTFQVSTRFLRECWTFLTGDPYGRERMHLVTGPISRDGTKVLSHMEKVSFAEQSAGFVSANPHETHRRLMELERDGHELMAMFHSHPMYSAEGTRPSDVDIANQKRFEKVGWDAIGGIFSIDGYVRLFGTDKSFDVEVYGKGSTRVSTKPREVILKLDVTPGGGA